MAKVLLTTDQVCSRYSVSEVTVWRWENAADYRHIGFPRPIRINRRKLWDQADLDAWDLTLRQMQTA